MFFVLFAHHLPFSQTCLSLEGALPEKWQKRLLAQKLRPLPEKVCFLPKNTGSPELCNGIWFDSRTRLAPALTE
jgi:hypothetical protein